MLGVVCCQYRDMHNLEHNSCYLCCLFDIHSNIYFSCIIEFIWVPWIYKILDYLVLFLRFLADRLEAFYVIEISCFILCLCFALHQRGHIACNYRCHFLNKTFLTYQSERLSSVDNYSSSKQICPEK